MRGAKTTMMLQRPTESLDSQNSTKYTWSDMRNITGNLSTSTSVMNRVKDLYGKKTDESTHIFTIHAQFGITITTQDRFRLDTDFYDILFPGKPANTKRQTELHLRKLISID